MADLNVERKGPSIWPWIIGLIVLALLIWALVELFEDDDAVVTDPAMEQPTVVDPAPAPVMPETMVAALPLSEIAQEPEAFEGRTVSGEVTVAEAGADGGFWAEDQGQRLFVVITEGGDDEPLNLRAGDRVRITDARVIAGDEVATAAEDVSPGALSTAEGEEVVLAAEASNIQLVSQDTGARTDTASTM